MNGAWSLSPGSDLTAGQLRHAIERMEAAPEFAAGPEIAIRNAIFELISVTSRPPSIDDAKEIAYQEALCKALWDYPIDVVVLACANWRRIPGQGRWWPTEQDLRVQCDMLVKPRKDLRDEAESLLRLLQRREQAESQGGRSRHNSPYGRTLALFNDCMASHGPAFCRSYLSMRTCEFSDTTIFTLGFVAERLQQRAGALIAKHQVIVRQCPDVTARVYADEDARAGDRPAPRKRSHQ